MSFRQRGRGKKMSSRLDYESNEQRLERLKEIFGIQKGRKSFGVVSSRIKGSVQSRLGTSRGRSNRSTELLRQRGPKVDLISGKSFAFSDNEKGAIMKRLGRKITVAPGNSNTLTMRISNKSQDARNTIIQKKLQQSRKQIITNREKARSQARFETLNSHRGISLTSRGHTESPLRVRVSNGAIVGGMRSDQMLYEKLKRNHRSQHVDTTSPLKRNLHVTTVKSNPFLATSSDRGLTISIRNPIKVAAHKEMEFRSKDVESSSDRFWSSGGVFTIHNELATQRLRSLSPPSNYRSVSKDVIDLTSQEMDVSPREDFVQEHRNLAPPRHQQTLNSEIQREIAILQGKRSISSSKLAGPGVKGLSLLPNHTTVSLSERFMQEKSVNS